MLNVERLMGWLCLAMSAALTSHNGSRIYEFLHILGLTEPCLIGMLIIGTGLVYASVTGHMKLRFCLLGANALIWACLYLILYYNLIALGPLALMCIVIVVHSVMRMYDLYGAIFSDKPRLR